MAIGVSELGNGSYRDLDDRGLVLDFQAGEAEAYQEIFRRYRALAWSIAFRLLASVDDAEEATQETMLRVYQGLPKFNGRYQLQAWVARIATNVSLDKLRARARRPQEAVAARDRIEDLQVDEARRVLHVGQDVVEVPGRIGGVVPEVRPHRHVVPAGLLLELQLVGHVAHRELDAPVPGRQEQAVSGCRTAGRCR